MASAARWQAGGARVTRATYRFREFRLVPDAEPDAEPVSFTMQCAVWAGPPPRTPAGRYPGAGPPAI
ncbi:DUF7848 domain-containing protein [Streptomyces albus]